MVARLVNVPRGVVVGGPAEAATDELLLEEEVGALVQLGPCLVNELVRVRLENGNRQDEAKLGQHNEEGEHQEELEQDLVLLAGSAPAQDAWRAISFRFVSFHFVTFHSLIRLDRV